MSAAPATAKLQRWVDLIAGVVGRHSAVTFDEILKAVPAYARMKAASAKRVFERDKAELRAFGVPLQTVGEEGDEESAYVIRSADFYLPYLTVVGGRGLSKPRRVDRYGYRALATLTFSPDELSAVAEAAARVRQLGDPALVASVDSALRKLAFDLPIAAAVAQDPVIIGPSRAAADPRVLATLSDALCARKRVAVDYYSMSSDEMTRREMEPYGLFFSNSHWYLVAREEGSAEIKNFRANRIRTCRRIGTSGSADYEIPKSFVLREHVGSRHAWELGSEAPTNVFVEVRGRTGACVAEARLGESVQERPTCRLFQVRRADPFIRWLLSFAGEIVPIEPPAICEAYQRLLRATLAVYEDSEEGGDERHGG